METMSASQLQELAHQFRIMANTLIDYEVTNWGSISINQHNVLNARESDLLNRASQFNVQAVIVLVQDATDTLEQVKFITQQMNQTVKKIQNASKVVEIAAAAVALGVALSTSNITLITTAAQGLTSLISDAT